jgi:hypothetical protein
MFQIYRPTGRLFCWVLAVMLAAWVGRSVAREASAIEPEMPASHLGEKPRVAEPAPQRFNLVQATPSTSNQASV